MSLAAVAAALEADKLAPPIAKAPTLGIAWYVIQTAPNCEVRAEKGVRESLGYRVFLPREVKWIKHARRKTIKEYPLFVGYLFVAFDIGRDNWKEICCERSQRIYGVDRLLGSEERPERVPSGGKGEGHPLGIDDLMQMEGMGLFNETIGGNLKPGSRVTVLTHSQLDLATRIKAVTPDKRAEIVFSLFGRENTVKVALSKIRPA